jgi:hypothetical protein
MGRREAAFSLLARDADVAYWPIATLTALRMNVGF